MSRPLTTEVTSAPGREQPPAVQVPRSQQTAASPSRQAAARYHRPAPHPHERHGLLPAIQTLTIIITVAVFIVTFNVQPFRIPSGSMEPTLLIGDFLLVDKQVTATAEDSSALLPSPAIHRGDVIVFHFPMNPEMHLVKRVVGLPGDHLRLRGGHVQIDGKPIDEPYAVYRPAAHDNFRDNFPRMESADPEIDSRWWMRMRKLVDDGELIVPAGNYFVLGDNRNDSEDSRYWGFVPEDSIVGRPLLIYFSLRDGQRDRVRALPRSSELAAGLTGFARWDRVLHIVR
ncbi:MAG: signal peptidase I [Edaphobacter sp.]|uniref:signal peptidase I n=1 Tax=Edaphobacter sp. TaxID=1934404 RepID=UPI0023A52770|nr:signal peptidase I [Edaphobacter sp.]MDE1178077.1 signal peptidase I [Edaphobacter sp.]